MKIDLWKNDDWVEGRYYKIGITKNPIHERMSEIRSDAKKDGQKIKLITLDKKECTLYQAFLMEQEILKSNDKDRVYRNWSTELFSKNIYENIDYYFDESFTMIEEII